MYQPGVRHLGDFTSAITDIIDAGADAYRTITQPAAPSFTLPTPYGAPSPYQAPNSVYDPRTGTYVPPGSLTSTLGAYAVPLMIGGGLLLFMMMGRKR